MTLARNDHAGVISPSPPPRVVEAAGGHVLPPAGKVQARPALAPRLVSAVAAVVLLLASLVLPLWQARLAAPQYPGGLLLQAYGGRVTGDVSEINNLNHYVGMRPFEAQAIPELQLWLPTVILGVALVFVASLARGRLLRGVAKLGLWAIPLGVLADIQFRLWQFGHDIDPEAALRIADFTPWVVGPTKVWNFRTTALPGLGLVAVMLAAALVSFGPGLWRRLRRARAVAYATATAAPAATAATAATAVAMAALVLLPAGAVGADESHDHHDHSSRPPPADGAPAGATEPDSTQPTGAGPQVDDLDEVELGVLDRLLREAPDGATVIVPPGIHRGHFTIDRPVILDGRGRAVLDGGGVGTVLRIRAPGSVAMQLEIRNSGHGPVDSPTGVLIEADDVHVHDVVLANVHHGVAVRGASRAQIHDNVITGHGGATRAADADHDVHHDSAGGPGDGISLWDATSVLVRNNVVSDVRDGIYLSFGREIMIDRNTVRSSRFGIHHMYTQDVTASENLFERNSAGMVLMYGGQVFALRNTLLDNRSAATGYGILAKDVIEVLLAENIVARNRVGIQAEIVSGGGADDTEIIRNTIASNDIALTLAPSLRAQVGGNSFIDNAVSLAFTGGRGEAGVTWLHRGAGNYWSEYRGTDTDGDGVGERPHPIGGGVDRLLARSPQLLGLAGSAAMGVLRAMEERFQLADPLAVDLQPLTRPISPALPSPQGAPSPISSALGGAAAVASVVWWRLMRRPSA